MTRSGEVRLSAGSGQLVAGSWQLGSSQLFGTTGRLKNKTGAFRRPSGFTPNLLAGFCQAALVPGSGVPVDQSLARSAIEKFHRCKPVLGVSTGGSSLDRSAERGSLGAIADRSGARFPHVLFR